MLANSVRELVQKQRHSEDCPQGGGPRLGQGSKADVSFREENVEQVEAGWVGAARRRVASLPPDMSSTYMP